MMQFCKIDPDGLFVEDVITDTQPTLEDGSPHPAYIATPCPSGFFWPRWNGEQWVEGGAAPEPVTPEPTPDERMDQVEAALMELAAIIAEVM